MTTPTKTFKNKSIYHSDLVRHGGGEGVTLMLMGEPRPSKYPKPETSHVAFLKFPEDETEYSLAVENTTLEAFQQTPTKKWLMAHPTGSASEPAAIWLSEAEGPPRTPAQAAPPTGQPGDTAHPPTTRPAVGPLGGDAVARAVENTVRAIEDLEASGLTVHPASVGAVYAAHFTAEAGR